MILSGLLDTWFVPGQIWVPSGWLVNLIFMQLITPCSFCYFITTTVIYCYYDIVDNRFLNTDIDLDTWELRQIHARSMLDPRQIHVRSTPDLTLAHHRGRLSEVLPFVSPLCCAVLC